jgi:RNA polymerase sigma-70 factor, ECF subfamily
LRKGPGMSKPRITKTEATKTEASKTDRLRPASRPHATEDGGNRPSPGNRAGEMKFQSREREYVFSVAMKYVKDEEEAADVAQDAMLNAYRHRASFRGDSRFTTWLYRVAATTALMHLRKKRRQKVALPPAPDSTDETDLVAEIPSGATSPEDAVAAHEALVLAGKRLDTLGDKYGQIFMMRFADGFSETEIAKELKLNVATVKTRAYRARAALREELQAAG